MHWIRSVAKATQYLSIIATLLLLPAMGLAQSPDPLPSWKDTPSREAILAFVDQVTDKTSADYVAPAERIATFDNDGTLWSEKPLYFQLMFAIDRVKMLAPQHTDWETQEPYASLLKGDTKTIAAGGMRVIGELLKTTHAGMTATEFEALVSDWLASARHPTTGRAYTEMVYQPMLELLNYLRSNGFKTFIVSGGGLDFMRPWVEKVYGIPPEQVVGSSIKTVYEVREGKPVLVRLPEIAFVDDKAGKPVGIHTHIGRRPLMAVGNSDGDLEMMQYTAAGEGPRLMVYVHHTDEAREWAYDRDSAVGRFDKGLDEARARGWTVIDMKRDWKVIYPDSKP